MEPTRKDIPTHGRRGVSLLHSYHLNTLHERQPHGLVTNQRHHAGRGGRRGLQQGQHRLHAHAAGLQDHRHLLFKGEPLQEGSSPHSYQDPVKGRGSPASLHVTQDGDPGVKAQAADHQLDTERKGVKMLY